MTNQSIPKPAGPMTLQESAFSEARFLLQGRSLTLRDPLYAVGQHCSIRIFALATGAGDCVLNFDFRAFERHSVNWSDFPVSIVWRDPVREVFGMPATVGLSHTGNGEVKLGTASQAPLFTVRTPVFMATPARLTTQLAWVAHPEERASRLEGWKLFDPDTPNVYYRASDDDRLRVFYDDSEHKLWFTFAGDASGLTVLWAIGTPEKLGSSGVAVLRLVANQWQTDLIPIEAAAGSRFYFDLGPADANWV